jgi:hypothetical protein
MKTSKIAFNVAGDLQTTRSRSPRRQQPHRSLRPSLIGFPSHPLGSLACMPSRSPRPTLAPLSTALILMALLPVDDLLGPTSSTPLRPRRLPGRFRPTQPRVDILKDPGQLFIAMELSNGHSSSSSRRGNLISSTVCTWSTRSLSATGSTETSAVGLLEGQKQQPTEGGE